MEYEIFLFCNLLALVVLILIIFYNLIGTYKIDKNQINFKVFQNKILKTDDNNNW